MDTISHKKGKIYYSMGEVSEMFDVNPSLIRFWEQKFDILKPHKNKKGNRMFTPDLPSGQGEGHDSCGSTETH